MCRFVALNSSDELFLAVHFTRFLSARAKNHCICLVLRLWVLQCVLFLLLSLFFRLKSPFLADYSTTKFTHEVQKYPKMDKKRSFLHNRTKHKSLMFHIKT